MSDHHYVSLNNNDGDDAPVKSQKVQSSTRGPIKSTTNEAPPSGLSSSSKPTIAAPPVTSISDGKGFVDYDDHIDGDGDDPATFCFFVMQLSLFACPFLALSVGLIWHWSDWGGLKTGTFASGAQCNEPLVLWLLMTTLLCGLASLFTVVSWLVRARCNGRWATDPLCRRLNSTPRRQQHYQLKKLFALIVVVATVVLAAVGGYWYYSTAVDHCTQTLLDWSHRFLNILFMVALFIGCGAMVAGACVYACHRGEKKVREREDLAIPKPSKLDIARAMM